MALGKPGPPTLSGQTTSLTTARCTIARGRLPGTSATTGARSTNQPRTSQSHPAGTSCQAEVSQLDSGSIQLDLPTRLHTVTPITRRERTWGAAGTKFLTRTSGNARSVGYRPRAMRHRLTQSGLAASILLGSLLLTACAEGAGNLEEPPPV